VIIIEKLKKISNFHRRFALTVGNFEGYHTGHRSIINTLKNEASKRNLSTCVITFKNHPLNLLKGIEPERLWAKCDKIITFYKEGIDLLIYLNFSKEFASQEPEDFLGIIRKTINPSLICLGETFKFGRNNKGDIKLIEKYGKESGWEFIPVDDLEMYGTKVSSTLIRNMIKNGDFKMTNTMLGKKYSLYLKPDHNKKNIMKLFIENMAVPTTGRFTGEMIDLQKKDYYNTTIEFDSGKIKLVRNNRIIGDSLYSFSFDNI